MQTVSDTLTTPTEYDKFVNQETGNIQLSQVCQGLSVALWGLLVAKARATFALSDLVEPEKIKQKVSKLVYLGLMVAVAQVLKMSAESNYIDKYVEVVETKVDSMLNEQRPGGPKVQSSSLNLQELNAFRSNQFKGDKTVNDFNFHEKVKFDHKKVTQQMKVKPEKSEMLMKRFVQYVSFFFSSSLTFICLFVSKKYHQEFDKLHKLNQIY